MHLILSRPIAYRICHTVAFTLSFTEEVYSVVVRQWLVLLFNSIFWVEWQSQNLLTPYQRCQSLDWNFLSIVLGKAYDEMQRLTFTCSFNFSLWAALSVSSTLISAMLPQQSSQLWPRTSTTWWQPLVLVTIAVMYSAPFSCLSLRAAYFLLLGNTNYNIGIPYRAAGSGGSSRHWWSVVLAIVIRSPQTPFVLSLSVFLPFHAASAQNASLDCSPISCHDLSH